MYLGEPTPSKHKYGMDASPKPSSIQMDSIKIIAISPDIHVFGEYFLVNFRKIIKAKYNLEEMYNQEISFSSEAPKKVQSCKGLSLEINMVKINTSRSCWSLTAQSNGITTRLLSQRGIWSRGLSLAQIYR